jgi:hypothetical protein
MNDTELCADLGVAPPINGGQNREELLEFARHCAARITRDLAGVSGWELFLVGGLEGQADAVVRAHLGATVVEARASGCDPAMAIWDAMCQVEQPLRLAATRIPCALQPTYSSD